MAGTGRRTTQQIRAELELERARLADAVASLRGEVRQATDVRGKVKAKLPAIAGATVVAAVLAGGVRAIRRRPSRRRR
jgi:hypothetical protein